MRAGARRGLLVLLAGTLAACSGGGSSVPTCSFSDPAALTADSPWPKFHHDEQNTGTVVSAAVSSNPGTCLWVFPPGGGSDSCSTALSVPAKGAFAASPVLSSDGKRIYIGSRDGTLYALNAADGTQVASTDFDFSIAQPITSTALVAHRAEGEVVFVGAGDGALYGLSNTGAAQETYWPSALGGFISGSPTLGADGTVYVTSLNGFFVGVCPNGIERFVYSTAGSRSSPAQGADGTLYVGSDDNQLHAVQPTGVTNWSFSAAGPILTAPVFDTDTNSIYVADRAGRVFKVGTNGRPDSSFAFGPVGPISSSPALAEDHLYFGSDDGNVYAIDKSSGDEAPRQPFPTGGAVLSSPAVATNPGSPAIVVIGSDDGNLYFLQDNGTSVALRAVFSIGAPVRSSPAIGSDGAVYVGADDGRVYAIGAPPPSS